jgi:ABC-type sugar transport system substrate-binding protein
MMRRMTALLAIFMLLSSAVVFADDEKPAKEELKEGLKEIGEGVTKAAHAVGKAVQKGAEEANKTAGKVLKKDGTEKQDNKKDAKD